MAKKVTDYQSALKIVEEFEKELNEVKSQILTLLTRNELTKESKDAVKKLNEEPFDSLYSEFKKILLHIQADNETDSEQNSNK